MVIQDDKMGQIELEFDFSPHPEDSYISDAYLLDEDREATDDEIEYLNDNYADIVQAEWYEDRVGMADFLSND